MAITHFIVHRVQRLSPTDACKLQLREQHFQLNGKIEEVFRELKQSYLKRLGKQYGRFSDDIGKSPLVALTKEFEEDKISFARMTSSVMQHVKLVMDSMDAVVEGHLFFAYEKLEIGTSLYLFWVHQNHAVALDGELTFNDVVVLDTSNVCWAARVNLDEWRSGDSQHYLGVVGWRGERDVSEALLDVLGFTDKVDTKADTESFLGAVDTYVTQLPEDDIPAVRGKIVDYCLEQDKRGQAVALSELSRHVNENAADELHKHIQQHSPQIKTQFIPDRAQMKNYVRISGRDELISMSFASGCLGETVVYDADSDCLTIRKIPSALKSRLLKHMRES